MAKARDIVRMSEAEISAFLAAVQNLQVATLGKHGEPHLTTVWFAVHEGKLMFETYGKSQKVVNLERDPRIAVLAEDGTTYGTLRGVSINGRAEIVTENPRLFDLMRLLIAHHFYLGKLIEDFKHDRNKHGHVFYRWLNEIPALPVLIAIVILVVVKPF